MSDGIDWQYRPGVPGDYELDHLLRAWQAGALDSGDGRQYLGEELAVAGYTEILACDPCWEKITGLHAVCQDDCSLPLDHDGECGPARRSGQPVRCQLCGRGDRLTRVDASTVGDV